MPTYQDWESTKLAPPWLRGLWGGRLLGVLGAVKDVIAQATVDGVKCRIVSAAPVDALPYIGAERNIERYRPDADGTYRARLADAWDIWDFGGTKQRLLDSLSAQGFTSARIDAWRDITYAPDPYTSWWSAFWVVVYAPHPFVADSAWGSGTWGDTVSSPNGGPPGPGTWGSNATLYDVAEVRGAIRKWKPAREVCAGIIFVVGSELWELLTPWAHGTWGDSYTIVWPG